MKVSGLRKPRIKKQKGSGYYKQEKKARGRPKRKPGTMR